MAHGKARFKNNKNQHRRGLGINPRSERKFKASAGKWGNHDPVISKVLTQVAREPRSHQSFRNQSMYPIINQIFPSPSHIANSRCKDNSRRGMKISDLHHQFEDLDSDDGHQSDSYSLPGMIRHMVSYYKL
jgi:hypothetical protein